MTNKEYLKSLTPEELVQTYFFTNCPYGELYIQIQESKGEQICDKKIALSKMTPEEIGDFVFKGKQKEVCTACKLRWLSEEREQKIAEAGK